MVRQSRPRIDISEPKQTEAFTRRSQRSDTADRVIGFVDNGRFLRQLHPDDRQDFRTLLRGLSFPPTLRMQRPSLAFGALRRTNGTRLRKRRRGTMTAALHHASKICTGD